MIALTGASVVEGVEAAEIDRAAIYSTQKAYWDSITTLEVVGEEFPLDTTLHRRQGQEITHHEFRILYGSNGRLSFRRVQKSGRGETTGLHQFRRDGRTFLGIMAYLKDPDAIDELVIRNQVDKPGHHDGEMCLILWGWMPGGKTIPVWLDEGGTLSPGRDQTGQEIAIVTSELRKRPIRIELDPDHDWLPRRIELVGDSTFEIKEFARDRGHWFPSEITQVIDGSAVQSGSGLRSGYKLTSLSVNRGVAEGSFGMPRLLDGSLVRDERNWSGYIQGGTKARDRLLKDRGERSASKSTPGAVGLAPQVVVAVEPGRFPWEMALVGAAVAVLALSWKLNQNSRNANSTGV